MKTKKVRMACIMLCILLVSIPCLGRKKPKGYIYVDKPEVFTRERLINERLEERSWLYKQLNNYTNTIQGFADIRSFKGLFVGIQAAIDTVSGLNSKREQQLADKEQEIKLDDISKQKEISDLNHELEVMKLRQQIKELNGNNSTSSTTASGNTSSQTGGTNQGEEGTGSENTTFDWKTNYDNLNKIDYPNPSDIVQSLAKLTSVETLKDQKSYRDQVRAMMRETELDDVHEINGATLYTLKFDVTVNMPDNLGKNPKFSRVNLIIEKNSSDYLDYFNLYKSWLARFEKEIKEKIEFIKSSIRYDLLSESEFDNLKYYISFKVDEKIFELDSILKNTVNSVEVKKLKKDKNNLNKINSYFSSFKYKKKMDLSVLDEFLYDYCLEQYKPLEEKYVIFTSYSQGLNVIYKQELVDNLKSYLQCPITDKVLNLLISEVNSLVTEMGSSIENIDKSGNNRVLITHALKKYDLDGIIGNIIDKLNQKFNTKKNSVQISNTGTKSDNCDENYMDDMQKLKDNYWKLKFHRNFLYFLIALREMEKAAPYVYVVEPKEYAQNISIVEANEKITSLMFNLNAILKPAGVKGDAYLNYIKKNQEKLQGVLRKPLVVGYANNSNEFGWLLGPRFQIEEDDGVNYSYTNVQYSLQASIIVPCWFNEINISKECYYGSKKIEENSNAKIKLENIRLSPDISMITSALLCREGVYRQQPQIEPRIYIIREGEENTGLHILGNHLWKNPVVFIGNRKTEDVKVMPDMKSIYAVFDKKFFLPKENEKEGITMDLTVITSDGTNTIKGAVKLLPPNVVEVIPQEKPIVKLLSRYTYFDGDLKFKASSELIPKNNKLKLQVRKKNGDSWITSTAKYKCHEPKDKFVEIIFSEFDDFSDTMEMNAILEISNTDSEKTEIFPIENSFIYFSSKQESEFKLKNTIPLEIQKVKDKEYYALNGDIEIEFANPTLFCKAYPDMTNILNENLSIQFITATGDEQNKRTTIELKNEDFSYSKETEKALIRIEKGKLNSNSYNAFGAIVKLINSTDSKSKDFSLKICLNDDFSINVNGILKLKLIK